MTSIPVRRPQPGRTFSAALPASGRLGVVYPLLLFWLFFEFGRPPNPVKMPLIISVTCLGIWLVQSKKQWNGYTAWWLVLLGSAALGVAFAPNTYAAFWSTWNMAILFLCICLPLQSVITSTDRLRGWILVFLVIAGYIGLWAATHGGYGPSGASGGQDENYVAALMCMAIALAYFSLFAEKARFTRVVLGASMLVFVAAIALAGNPSRGGFLALCAVGAYCLWRSPKKMVGIGVAAVAVLGLIVLAGPAFWAEISTTTDTTSDTADMRLEIWKGGLRMWQANPILGVGAGNFRWVLDDYQTVEQTAKFGRSLGGSIIAHSFWVEMLAELGAVGVIATGMLVFKTWTGLGKIRDETMRLTKGRSPDPELVRFRCYADAIRAGMLAILVNGVFLSLFYYSHLWLLMALGGGLIYLYRHRNVEGLPGIDTRILAPALASGPRRGIVPHRSAPVQTGPRSGRRGSR